MRILEGELIKMDETSSAHLAKLAEAEKLINLAIENEDGTKATLREIVDLLHSRWEQGGEDDFHFKRLNQTKPMRARIRLSAEKQAVYEEMLAAIRRERDRLNAGGAFKASTDLNAKFLQQNRAMITLKARIKTQPWWGKERDRTARARELINEIEERMRNRRVLATALLNKLSTEAGFKSLNDVMAGR